MTEATKVLTKWLRGSSKFTPEKLTEEVAHALMMLGCVKQLFDLDDKNILDEQLKACRKWEGNKDELQV